METIYTEVADNGATINNILSIVTALFITLIVEIPYIYKVLKYKSIKNIIGINVFTNILFNTVLYMWALVFNKGLLAPIITGGIWIVFELIFIPLTEIKFYKKTNVYNLVLKNIILHTYIANALSCVICWLLMKYVLMF